MKHEPPEVPPLPRPRRGPGRWTSFVAEPDPASSPVRGLHEQTNPTHRVRVEHDDHTLLIHLSGEDGGDWTTVAVDRNTRQWAIAQDRRQSDTARAAYRQLYEPDGPAPRRHASGSRKSIAD